MNILLVTMEMQVGGAETHILELAKELKKRQHNVFVMSAGGKYAELLEKAGIQHIFAPLKDKKITNMIKAYKLIKRAIIENKIDVVHAHARIPAFISGKVCKKLNIPFVTTAHGVYKINTILKCLTNWGEKTLAVSEDIKEQIIRDYKLNPNDVDVTVNGINTESFCKEYIKEIAEKLGVDDRTFSIIHVSRLDKQSSNVAKLLISIFKDLEEKIETNLKLIIVGDGDEFETVNNMAKVHSNIIMTGLRTDVADILKCGKVFVGVSRAALEAMSCEMPVILAGNKDYGQGQIGLFDETRKEQAISTNFCCRGCEDTTEDKLLRDIIKVYSMSEAEVMELGKYGRNIVIENYSVEKMADDALKLYEKVLTNHIKHGKIS